MNDFFVCNSTTKIATSMLKINNLGIFKHLNDIRFIQKVTIIIFNEFLSQEKIFQFGTTIDFNANVELKITVVI